MVIDFWDFLDQILISIYIIIFWTFCMGFFRWSIRENQTIPPSVRISLSVLWCYLVLPLFDYRKNADEQKHLMHNKFWLRFFSLQNSWQPKEFAHLKSDFLFSSDQISACKARGSDLRVHFKVLWFELSRSFGLCHAAVLSFNNWSIKYHRNGMRYELYVIICWTFDCIRLWWCFNHGR